MQACMYVFVRAYMRAYITESSHLTPTEVSQSTGQFNGRLQINTMAGQYKYNANTCVATVMNDFTHAVASHIAHQVTLWWSLVNILNTVALSVHIQVTNRTKNMPINFFLFRFMSTWVSSRVVLFLTLQSPVLFLPCLIP